MENNIVVYQAVAIESLRIQPDFLTKFPQYGRLYRRVITRLETTRPTDSPALEAVTNLGGLVFSFARRIGGVEPFKSNWKEHVWNSEIFIAGQRNDPEPFQRWAEVVNDFEERWRSSGLTNPTVLPIVEQVLTHVNLWTDESVRTLVLHHLVKRCSVLFSGIENVRNHFVATIPQGDMANVAEALDLVVTVSDNVTEADAKRPISIMQYPNIIQHPRYKDLATGGEWEAFNNTGVGKKLGLFSSVYWWVEPNPEGEISPRMEMVRYRQIMREALADYLEDPEYQGFAAHPFETIEQALQTFRIGS